MQPALAGVSSTWGRRRPAVPRKPVVGAATRCANGRNCVRSRPTDGAPTRLRLRGKDWASCSRVPVGMLHAWQRSSTERLRRLTKRRLRHRARAQTWQRGLLSLATPSSGGALATRTHGGPPSAWERKGLAVQREPVVGAAARRASCANATRPQPEAATPPKTQHTHTFLHV